MHQPLGPNTQHHIVCSISFKSAWLKVVHWSSSVHLHIHLSFMFTIHSMPSRTQETLSCECNLYHYNNSILALLKVLFLFSFSFYSSCSSGRGSHCVFPAAPCSKNCMYRMPTLWDIYPISSEVVLPLSNPPLWVRGHWGSHCMLEDELQAKAKARVWVRMQSDDTFKTLSRWVMTMWSCWRLRCPICTQGFMWLTLHSTVL